MLQIIGRRQSALNARVHEDECALTVSMFGAAAYVFHLIQKTSSQKLYKVIIFQPNFNAYR